MGEPIKQKDQQPEQKLNSIFNTVDSSEFKQKLPNTFVIGEEIDTVLLKEYNDLYLLKKELSRTYRKIKKGAINAVNVFPFSCLINEDVTTCWVELYNSRENERKVILDDFDGPYILQDCHKVALLLIEQVLIPMGWVKGVDLSSELEKEIFEGLTILLRLNTNKSYYWRIVFKDEYFELMPWEENDEEGK